MYSVGYVTFDNVDCVYTIDNAGIRLIPAQKEDIRKLNRHFDDQNFLFYYSDEVDRNCIAHIDRVEMNGGHSLHLFPKYLLRLFNTNPISSMLITGASIDEVFHPAGYYYTKHEAGKKNETDLTHDIEIADHWEITIDEKTVEVSLQYGGILHRGIASDMMLHPQLFATFPPTTDYQFMFKVYTVIIRFMQLLQYNSNCGKCKVYLRGNEPDYNSGYLFDWAFIEEKRRFYNEVQYRYFKPYMRNILQFSADNTSISLDYLPNAEYRWNRTDYTPQILTSLFAAFESEYKANIRAYETEPVEDYSNLKKEIIHKIQECTTSSMTDSEKEFLSKAGNTILNLGNQAGQTKKVKNVLHVLHNALRSSAEHLLIRGKIGTKNGFSEEEINRISKELVGLRALVSHEYSLSAFDDLQAEFIHFLEILVHAQMLKRAGINDTGIELIIGIVFHCNYKYMEELQKTIQKEEKKKAIKPYD